MGQNQALARASSPSLLPPLGKYQLLSLLGSGGMADVYLAAQRAQGGFTKLVVVKVLREPEPSADSELESREQIAEWVRMFNQEARLAARLNHVNVVQTLEAGEQEGRHVIVMEHLDGRSVQQVAERERELGKWLPLSARTRIAIDALAGLDYAHELRDFDGMPLGIVHRDVSPHNIFLTFDGRVKVLDFGIAKLALPGDSTETGVLKGKVRYMAPEQAMGEAVDRATDQFALGLVLWELLAGQNLWGEQNEMQILQTLLNRDPLPDLALANSAVPPRLARACMRALEYEPARRFPSCAALREELVCCLEELPYPITNEELGQSVSSMFAEFREKQRQVLARKLTPEPAVETPVSDYPVSHERLRRPRQRAPLFALAAVLFAAGAAYVFFGVTDPSHATASNAEPGLGPAASDATPATTTLPSSITATGTPEPASAPPSAAAAPTKASKSKARGRGRKKRAPAVAEESAPPSATTAPVPPTPSAPAKAGSQLHLDTDNPWSTGAATKP